MVQILKRLNGNGPAILVLTFALLLRFWDLNSIPFTHDEFSSIKRASYQTLIESWNLGISDDAHPPLSQLFYFGWMKIAGNEACAIKLPYMLMAWLGLVFTFLVAKNWFGTTSAIVTIAILAVMQESVINSQIARPYAMGSFFVMMAAWGLQKIVLSKAHKPQFFVLFVTVLGLSAAALTHHFAMLAAFILAAGHLILFGRTSYRSLLPVYAMAILLYLPNLPLLRIQLNTGGIASVLASPDWSYLIKYVKYIFHFSYVFTVMIAALILLSFFTKKKGIVYPSFIVVACVFVLSFTIGFAYSVQVSPVMPFRSLYFALPFLIMSLFAFFGELSRSLNYVIAIGITAIGSYSLIMERQHYKVFYTDGYRNIHTTAIKWAENEGAGAIVSYLPHILQYEEEHLQKSDNSRFNPNEQWTMKDYQQAISAQQEKATFVLANSWQYYKIPTEVFGMVYDAYGHITLQQNYFNSWLFVFDRATNNNRTQYLNQDEKETSIGGKQIKRESANHEMVHFGNGDEFGYLVSMKFPGTQGSYRDWIIASATVQDMRSSNAMLVVEAKDDTGKTIHYHARSFDEFLSEGQDSGRVYLGIFSPDIFKKYTGYTINAYIWNKGGTFDVTDLNFLRIDGNKIMYALEEKVFRTDLDYLPGYE